MVHLLGDVTVTVNDSVGCDDHKGVWPAKLGGHLVS